MISSYPTRNRKLQKNNKKIQKTSKHHYSLFSSENRLGKAEKERQKKNRSAVLQSALEQRISKIQQNNSKNQKTPSQLLFKRKQVGMGRERGKIKEKCSDVFLGGPVKEN